MSDSVIHAMAGAAGGMIAMSCTYPLIFLSTRAAVETNSEQKSVCHAIVDTVKREGVLGLYSGLSSSLLGVAVTNGYDPGFSLVVARTNSFHIGFITISMSGLEA